jgi:hypothetical protein
MRITADWSLIAELAQEVSHVGMVLKIPGRQVRRRPLDLERPKGRGCLSASQIRPKDDRGLLRLDRPKRIRTCAYGRAVGWFHQRYHTAGDEVRYDNGIPVTRPAVASKVISQNQRSTLVAEQILDILESMGNSSQVASPSHRRQMAEQFSIGRQRVREALSACNRCYEKCRGSGTSVELYGQGCPTAFPRGTHDRPESVEHFGGKACGNRSRA